MRKTWLYIALCCMLVGGTRLSHAQVPISFYDFARPTLNWYTIDTQHFNIIYHLEDDGPGSSRTAQVVARIAEEVYEPITDLYQHWPDTKVAIILKDYEDYSNGAAYFFDNKIEIWAPSLDAPLRGDHNWLRNVITHEFTHIIQVQKTMKAGRRLPFLYFQLLDYENVSRPDVLYGYPNVIVTYPVPVLNNPAWFAEGTAQYQRQWLHYDDWDSHRDMLLRTRVIAGEQLPLEDMGGFYSQTSLLRETTYNQGFAFTRYLARRFGEEILMEISQSLGKWKNWNVERAIKDATGIAGKKVYEQWINELQSSYREEVSDLLPNLVQGSIIEHEGASNFYPQYAPDGKKVAYVSNKGRDFNQLSLYVKDLESSSMASIELDGLSAAPLRTHTCALGHKLKSGVGRSFSWHPSGESIVYVRRKDSPEGYLYADLYSINLETEKVERLTTELRATSPVYDKTGRYIAFIVQSDGSTNLYKLDTTTEEVTPLTTYQNGSQVTDPVWHPSGEWLYFGLQNEAGRDIYRVDANGELVEAVLRTEHDERSPAFGEEGKTLYFSSDRNGIYNIYGLALQQQEGDTERQLEQFTNVIGGAFMPNVLNGKIVFSRYEYDGYRIAELEDLGGSKSINPDWTYTYPEIISKPTAFTVSSSDSTSSEQNTHYALNDFDDTDLAPYASVANIPLSTQQRSNRAASENTTPDSGAPGNEEPLAHKPYSFEFTSFSFYPVLRFDQYVSRRRRALDVRLADRGRFETLARNTKVGVLMSSREILEGLNVFAGVLVGPTSRGASSIGDFFSPSRLLRLERDVFLQFDYNKGLSFIPKRWSPQLSLEVFNIRRNVDNGLSIEEFPCTACFPDTTLADLSYNLWEVGLKARSKVNRFLLLEAGYRYSPYSVTTERFFSKESDQFIDPFTSTYFIGTGASLKGILEWNAPHRHSDVVPVGIRAELAYDREVGRLLERFDIEDGRIEPVYERHRFHRVSFESRLGMMLPGKIFKAPHGFGVRARLSTIIGKTVDDFFNDYVGGLAGARGYPFYAMGGNETLWLQGSYLFPLLPSIEKQVMFTYVDKLYARVYADAAAAWNGPLTSPGALRKDVGAELRLGLGSFYLLPTAIFVSATYGLDSFTFALDEGFLTPDGASTVEYGNAWQWHLGILFGFDL